MNNEPAWVNLLREACALGSQSEVAKSIGYSPAVVSSVLKSSYKGDLKRVQMAVEGALMHHSVDCPVIGELPRQRCVEHQRTPLMTTNPSRIALYKACRAGCPHSLIGKGDEA